MKNFLKLSDLSAEEIAEVARAAGEPAWLIERRVAAWNFFAAAIPPEWRRTDLSALHADTIVTPTAPQGTQLLWDEQLAAQGVVFTPLRAALQSHAQLIEHHMDSAVLPLTHKFSALRAALWQDGAFLYVPRNVATESVLRVRYTLTAGNHAIFPRTLVILEANTHVTLIEEFVSADEAETRLAAPTSEIFCGPGSELHLVSLQRWGSNVYHLGGQKVVLDRDAGCEWTAISLGAKVQHNESETRLVGDGSHINWLGATFADGQQRLLSAPCLRHVGANAESYMEYKTVVNDEGYSIFDGMILIEKGSRATSTRLEEHAIHLSKQARNDSIPGLKIDTNDVAKAGHASTSGEVDEEQLFYMRARGISRDDALRMIVMGFFEQALATIPLEALRDEVRVAIEAKI